MLQINTLYLIALTATFSILFVRRIGLADKIIEHSKIKLISELFSCDYCLSFWTSFIVSAFYAVIFKDITYLVYSILSTPIVRFLL